MNRREDPHRPEDPADVGVLFVHGIGEQKHADTLVQFGEALKTWLEDWLSVDARPGGALRITYADLNQDPEQAPAHAKLHVHCDGIRTTWLLAESWWAASFQAPKYSDLWRWSLEVVPLAVADHVVRRFHMARGVYRTTYESAMVLLAIALLPLMTSTITISLVLGILPIPTLRTAIVRFQKLLLGTVGDSYTLLESSIRGAAMSSRVQDDLRWLHKRAHKTVVVAHSQGAAVAHAALQAVDSTKPDLFFTFGSGVRKLLVLDFIRGGSRMMIWLTTVGLLLVSVASWMAYKLVVDPTWRVPIFAMQGLDPKNLYGWDLTNFLGVVDLTNWRWITGIATIIGSALGLLGSEGSPLKRMGFVTMGAGIFALMGLAIATVISSGPPSFIAAFLFGGGLLAFVSGLSSLGTKEIDQEIDKRLKPLPGVMWVDRYASSDPVPNGPLLSSNADANVLVDSHPVSNLASTLRDHTSYWQNRDQFVSCVANAIAGVANVKLGRTEFDAERQDWAGERRRWRVGWLRVCRVFAVVVAGALILRFRGGQWHTSADMPTWLQALFDEFVYVGESIPFIRLIVGDGLKSALVQALWLASVFLCVWLVYKLFHAVWSWWDRLEMRALFARRGYQPFPLPFLVLIGVLMSAVIVSGVLTLSLDQQLIQAIRDDPWLLAIRNETWKGLYSFHPSGIGMTVLLALSSASIAGMIADGFQSFRSLGGVLFDWKRVSGYALLALSALAPVAMRIVSRSDEPSTQLNQQTFGLIMYGASAFGLIPIGLFCAAVGSPVGRRMMERVHRWSASGPFGRWLARASGGTSRVTRDRLCVRVDELLRESLPIRTSAKEAAAKRFCNDEAVALVRGLSPPQNSDDRIALLNLARAFPYAAVAAAEILAQSDPHFARDMFKVAGAIPRGLRRRARELEKMLGRVEAEVVSSV